MQYHFCYTLYNALPLVMYTSYLHNIFTARIIFDFYPQAPAYAVASTAASTSGTLGHGFLIAS